MNELYPTKVRSTALGICSASARVATLISAPLPIVVGSTVTLALIGSACAIALPASWFLLPETLGRALADDSAAGGEEKPRELPTPQLVGDSPTA